MKKTVITKKRLYRCKCKHTFYKEYKKRGFFTRLFRGGLSAKCVMCGSKARYVRVITKTKIVKVEE